MPRKASLHAGRPSVRPLESPTDAVALLSREFDVRITPAESFCGSHTMAKTFLEMLAPAVQRLKSTFHGLHRWCKGQIVVFSVCTGGARGEKWFLRFAPPVQAFPKALWLLLRAIKDILQGFESPFFRRTHVIIKVRARTLIYFFPPCMRPQTAKTQGFKTCYPKNARKFIPLDLCD